MNDNTMMTLKIISAEKIEFEGQVQSVSLPGVQGRFQVLQNHAALIAALTHGQLVWVNSDGTENSRDIMGGVADVKDNVVMVCLFY